MMMQQTLFNCGATPRPKYFSDEVTAMTVDELMPKVLKWMKVQIGESFLQEIKEDLIVAISYEDDSFNITSSLKELHWNCDRELVDILDEVGFIRYDMHKVVLANWVSSQGVTPSFSVGHRVVYRRSYDVASHEGEIIKVVGETAQYLIFSEQLGHIRSSSRQSGTTGTYVNFEDVIGFIEEAHADVFS